MEDKIVEILFKTILTNTEIKQCTEELLNLFNVNNSFVEEYVEHCIMCRENGLPMLDWYSYKKQYCC